MEPDQGNSQRDMGPETAGTGRREAAAAAEEDACGYAPLATA